MIIIKKFLCFKTRKNCFKIVSFPRYAERKINEILKKADLSFDDLVYEAIRQLVEDLTSKTK